MSNATSDNLVFQLITGIISRSSLSRYHDEHILFVGCLFPQREGSLYIRIYKKQRRMSEDAAEKSYYFGTKNQEYDNFELINQAHDSVMTQIFSRMQENHLQVMKKLDNLLKSQTLQQKLCEIIDKKFNQITNKIMDKLATIIQDITKGQPKSIQKARQNSSPPRPIRQIEHERTYSPLNCNIQQEQEQENSMMINLAESEMEPFHEFMETAVDQEISFKKDDDFRQENNEISNILEIFMNTFQEMGLEIAECNKIFQFPKMAHLNFHSFIDSKKNILFLTELQNGEVFGAFTHLQFNPQPNYIPRENPKSFLCNITKQIFAFASRVNKTHSYDEDYLIFGNWQIKVRQKADILESCWGTNGDCFRLKRYGKIERLDISPLEFFGKGIQTKAIKMKRYNIYAFS